MKILTSVVLEIVAVVLGLEAMACCLALHLIALPMTIQAGIATLGLTTFIAGFIAFGSGVDEIERAVVRQWKSLAS